MVVRMALLIDVNSFQRKETWEKSVEALKTFILEMITKELTTKDRLCRVFDMLYAVKFFNSSRDTDFKFGLKFKHFNLTTHETNEEALTMLVSKLFENGGLPSPVNKLDYMKTAVKKITADLEWEEPVMDLRSKGQSNSTRSVPGPSTSQSQASGPPALQPEPDINLVYIFMRVPRTWTDLYNSVLNLDEIVSSDALVEALLPTPFFKKAVHQYKIKFKFVDMNFYEDEHWNGKYPAPLEEALVKLGNRDGSCILPKTKYCQRGPGIPSVLSILKHYLSKVAARNT